MENETHNLIFILAHTMLILLTLFYIRFILDNPQYVNNKKVLDVGSGSAACALASAIAGASQVTANDIDPGANEKN